MPWNSRVRVCFALWFLGGSPTCYHCILDIVLNLDAWCVSSSWPLPVNIKLYMTCAGCDASVWIGTCCSILDVMPQIIHQTDPVLNSLVIATVYTYSAIFPAVSGICCSFSYI